MTCVFCERILVDAYDAGNEHAVTFEPLAPVTRGHRLFVPRIHVAGALTYPHLTGLVMDYAASWAARYGKYPCNFIETPSRKPLASAMGRNRSSRVAGQG